MMPYINVKVLLGVVSWNTVLQAGHAAISFNSSICDYLLENHTELGPSIFIIDGVALVKLWPSLRIRKWLPGERATFVVV